MAKSMKDLMGDSTGIEASCGPGNPEPMGQIGPIEQIGMSPRVTEIQVEAVVGGVLQRITLAGVMPADVGELIRGWDANAKVRDDFPQRGGGGRETKCARVDVIQITGDEGRKSIVLLSSGEDEDLLIKVSGKPGAGDAFLKQLRGLGKVAEKDLSKLEKAFAGPGTAIVNLGAKSKFGARYFTSSDGNYLDTGYSKRRV